jgi:hypothetical protein
MCWRRVWVGHVNSAQIAMVDMGSGRADDASAVGRRPGKERADSGFSWVEAARATVCVWICSDGFKSQKKWR